MADRKDDWMKRGFDAGWNDALRKMDHIVGVRQAQWPARSSMYASLEDVRRDLRALAVPRAAAHASAEEG